MELIVYKDTMPKGPQKPTQVVVWRHNKEGPGLFPEIDHRYPDGRYLSGKPGEYWFEIPPLPKDE